MSVPQSMPTLLSISDLSISFVSRDKVERRVVENVSFDIRAGEIVGLVGESGSGKTLIGRSIVRILPRSAFISGGYICFEEEPLHDMSAERIRKLRGSQIAMIFQEPMSSLNPALRIGFQLSEGIRLRERVSNSEARERCVAMLEKVQMPRPADCLNSYPYEFSGGMRQRIMLASALMSRPKLLIADEPTTALDAIISNEVLQLMTSLTKEMGTAVLFISHDLNIITKYAHRALVLRRGRLIDSGTPEEVLLAPRHEFTRELLHALPKRRSMSHSQVASSSLVTVKNVTVEFKSRGPHLFSRRRMRAVHGATISLNSAETFALVGESGSGKTTLGRVLLRLVDNYEGTVKFRGAEIRELSKAELAAFRAGTQMVFQDPFTSMDPRMKVVQIVAEGLRHDKQLSSRTRVERALEMLEKVGLDRDFANRLPHELSGGQRQRVCIARSIISNPQLVVADEPVSALDVTIQHQILKLLSSLQADYGFACLLISHDLAVVEEMADRVAVMYMGQILEVAPRDTIFSSPKHPYTVRLLRATPRIIPKSEGLYELSESNFSPSPPPEGFEYFNHGSIPGVRLSMSPPEMLEINSGHFVCCSSIG